MPATLPPWVVLHIPHDSTYVPPDVRRRLLLSDADLDRELLRMTDGWTHALFGAGVPPSRIHAAPVSRLVVDVERFEDDAAECMAARGMGVVYTRTHDKRVLRRKPTACERERLLSLWYRPHHESLAEAVDASLARWGRALVVDAHSFASRALPYEENAAAARPQICVGTDDFHTPEWLKDSFCSAFGGHGFEVGVNTPFAGALVPGRHYRRDARVMAVMVEVRRDLYEHEESGALRSGFVSVARGLRESVAQALAA